MKEEKNINFFDTDPAVETGERNFLTLFHKTLSPMLIIDDKGNYKHCNEAGLLFLETTKEEIIKKKVFDFIPPEEEENSVMKEHEPLWEKGGAIETKYYVNGRIKILDLMIVPITLEGNKYFCGMGVDITERKQTALALEESERRYRTFIQNFQGIAFRGTLNFVPIFFQGAVEKITGYTEAEFTSGSLTWDKVIFPEDLPEVMEHGEAMRTIPNYTSQREYRIVRKDGQIRWVHEKIQNVCDEADMPIYLEGSIHDITGRKKVEEQLKESEEQNRKILDTVDEGFVIVDRNYRILTANRGYCEQVSLPSSEVLGKHCYEVSHQSERPCYEAGEECAVQKVFATGETHSALHRHPGKEGQVLFVETKAFPIRNESGQVTSAIETINNITERHLLQEERLKTQKLQSIGTLAGGIAHDFNNLLQGVFGHISMARVKIDQKEESLLMLERAEEALHQTVNLTNQLLTFAKGGRPAKKPFPVLPTLENAARFAISGSSCDYEILSQGDLWQINGDAGQIAQVIQNIVLNAEQSMPQGGKIKITVHKVPSDSEMPAVLDKGDYVSISMRDNGLGIPEKYLDRIFDPYFTTKERGSGLGLATSHSIVRNHGGVIVVESQLGEGTTFTMYLPAIREKIREPAAVVPPVDVPSARVLVMDDEEMIREVTRNLLRALGHECELAEEGKSAVAMFKAARNGGRPFDLVLLDLTIRDGMGGGETLQELLAIDPEVKAIVSSGYSDDDILSDYQSQGFKMFLKKPYKLEDLQKAINSLLV